MTSARILVVEDERITAADIEDILVGFGHEVVEVVSTAEEALRAARFKRPDLVLMDIQIQGETDGCEVARNIRDRFGIPAVFLTAHADDATLEKAKQADPLGYIVKPFHENELQAVVQMALNHDLVDRERDEKAEELSSTLAALGEGVIRTDEMGRVRFLNPAASRWTGWDAAAAVGKQVAEVFRLLERSTSRSLEAFTMAAIRELSVVELPSGSVVRSRDGVERPVHGSVAPVRNGSDRISGAVVAFGKAPAVEGPENRTGATPAARSSPAASRGGQADSGIVVASPPMKELMKFCRRIAGSGVTTVLVLGESGSGKDVFARFLHEHSKRRDQPFVTLNCAAIPETLIESEIFGYEKGAFTDARAQKKGVLDLADGGTVFLDEIGDLQPHLQAKLLRVLEEQSFRRLGGIKDIQVDLRIITATNKDLAEAVRSKEFRQDLYYRLNVIQIWIPPLRERDEDILPLVRHFISLYNDKFEQQIEGVSPEAEGKLLGHDWPGNVREVRNTVERAMVLEDQQTIQADNIAFGDEVIFGAEARSRTPAVAGESSLEEVERSMLEQALEKCDGNQTRAAKLLGVTRDTLRYRIKKFELQ